ncbi:similar to CAF1 family ribonuclease [Plenodomus lingam JN3]|uniref:Similar to CAF1 family ribonuclease n=1 Tax=Leptosphaeria maculans (strain JN3 / isolate v23.1.3 / race Av1-4-5-6-7-8) TaxID=985895 RepID=E5A111_LEPMJ|nr:similar to CAF1 family ribonuclease [Plenodomus lingam JN3]CBX97307.1 similar to CAF1 family ribonuclease [Plenodomus lingam JN3]
MEVDAESFPHHLTGLFIHISEADFVAFDLELSGIPSRLPDKPARGRGRYTLEERYAETKHGADRYQILQVGLTCARFDYIANKYVLRPYNINICPLLDERLDFEREIRFQSGACSFLLSHGFNLGAPFASGVQYLSRQEAARARQMAWDRIEKKNPVEDMQLKEEHVDSLDFVRRVREAITQWKTTNSDCLEVTTHTGLPKAPHVQAISRFEKRLVHQLVRAEFPDQVSIGRHDCIRIIDHDVEREADNVRRMKSRVKEQIIRQTGFRWIFEALVKGGDIDRAEPLYLSRTSSLTADVSGLKDRYDRAVERLKTRQPVLVGHNMFTDIVYLYRTFVGELPDTLQGFREVIHELFPKIVDTKYLATYTEGDLNASPTLQEIAQGLSHQYLPEIVTHPDHSKYEGAEAFHEAGYDSLLTATIMIRLAARLGAEQTAEVDPIYPPEPVPKSNPTSTPLQDFLHNNQEEPQTPITSPQSSTQTQPPSASRRRKPKRNSKKAKLEAKPRFHTTNIFDNLRTLSLDPSSPTTPSSVSADEQDPTSTFSYNDAPANANANANAQWDHVHEGPAAGSWVDEKFVQDQTGWVAIERLQRRPMELMPSFEQARFWCGLGNRVRVFGTVEGMLEVAGWEGV